MPPPAIDATAAEESLGPSDRERQVMLQLTNVSHAVNHFQNQMMTMLYPYIMASLGMTYTQVGTLSAIRSILGSLSQGTYGFLTPFFGRCKLLGLGNLGIALGTLLSGLAASYPMLIVARCVAAVGTSAQHPVGNSILAGYFPRSRASILALNTSISNVGTMVATPVATAMLLVMSWRDIFFVVTFASLVMGAVYFLFKDYGVNRVEPGRARLASGFDSYKRVIKNRNMMIIALIFMVGGAGREGGVNQTYFGPHLKDDFGMGVVTVGTLLFAISLGGVLGPIIFGWLSDRLDRIKMLQLSLALSFAGSLWVAQMGPAVLILFVGLVIYGGVTTSRGTQTQAIIADSVSDRDRDAAYSMYFLLGFASQPFWLLVTGLLMDARGFGTALTALSFTYILGIALLFLLRDERRQGAPAETS
jgi:MFS family permease